MDVERVEFVGLGPPDDRRQPVVENDDYARFARRIVAAHARRIAAGDVDDLRDLDALGRAWEAAMYDAVSGLRDAGFSCAEIGARLGITRQAVHQRWGGEHP